MIHAIINVQSDKLSPRCTTNCCQQKTTLFFSMTTKVEQRPNLSETRVRDFPRQSLTARNEVLWCQACYKNVPTHKGNLRDHLASKKHKKDLETWINKKRKIILKIPSPKAYFCICMDFI